MLENQLEKERKRKNKEIYISLSEGKLIGLNERRICNIGYIFLKKIFKTIEDREFHYLVCLLAVLVYRVLEKKLDNEHKYKELSSTLKGMELQIQKEKVAYLPNYIRTKLTDALHEKINFRTDYEILEYSYLKGLFTF